MKANRINISSENRHLRQARKRYKQSNLKHNDTKSSNKCN